MLEKFKSRKFIIAVLTIVLGVATALAEIGGKIGAICGILAAFVSAAVYIIVEGNIDAKAVQLITEGVKETIDYFDGEDETEAETDTENNKENEAEAV